MYNMYISYLFIGTDKFNLLSFQHKTMDWVILFIEQFPYMIV